MQEMEPHRWSQMNDCRSDMRPLRGDKLCLGDVGGRGGRIQPKRRVWSDDLQLGASHVRAEALAFVALAMRRGIYNRSLMVVLAAIAVIAIVNCRQRCFGYVAVQAMARPMAAPAGGGLRQHENCHQFGNKRLHSDQYILPYHYGHRQSGQRSLRQTWAARGAGGVSDAHYR
jgi:hypothetical protein